MQRTITAKFVAWPSARFVRPAGREWERRLGLHSCLSFQRAAARPTVLYPLRAAAADWSPAESAHKGPRTGLVRHSVAATTRAASHSNLAAAPWRG